MGLNVYGIAIGAKISNVLRVTQQLNISTVTEVNGDFAFENATSGFKNDDEMFVTEILSGTLLTFSDVLIVYNLKLENFHKHGKVLKFLISETSMTFAFEYYDNGKLTRSGVSDNGVRIKDEEFGIPLEIEDYESDYSEIIMLLSSQITGKAIDEIDPSTTSKKYMLTM